MKQLQGKYGGMYSAQNVVLSGTHTHSGPGGYLQYVLLIITSKGWVQQSFDALVAGIVQVYQNYNGIAICAIFVSNFPFPF